MFIERFCGYLRIKLGSNGKSLSYPIFYYRKGTQMSISGTTAARGLKFWLQVALGVPFATP